MGSASPVTFLSIRRTCLASEEIDLAAYPHSSEGKYPFPSTSVNDYHKDHSYRYKSCFILSQECSSLFLSAQRPRGDALKTGEYYMVFRGNRRVHAYSFFEHMNLACVWWIAFMLLMR